MSDRSPGDVSKRMIVWSNCQPARSEEGVDETIDSNMFVPFCLSRSITKFRRIGGTGRAGNGSQRWERIDSISW